MTLLYIDPGSGSLLIQALIAGAISFWNFSNTKFQVLLDSLVRKDKYRIIITRDHGFRADKNIDFHSTFGAFYGFEKGDVDKTVTVQDVGSLIDSYFKN